MAIYPLLLFGICVGGFPFCSNEFVSAFPFVLPFAPTENSHTTRMSFSICQINSVTSLFNQKSLWFGLNTHTLTHRVGTYFIHITLTTSICIIHKMGNKL